MPFRKIKLKKKNDKKNSLKENVLDRPTIKIALAGNPNVGKSAIFNQLTGLSQTIGNWPGKTVEKMEGYLDFKGYFFDIVDLPGIYSLSTYSLEEIVSREYIVSDETDLIINVIDGTNLERNLFFTFQLLELKVPMILAINQMDILRKRNIDIDFTKFEELFKLPVLPLVAVHGTGVHQLLEKAIELVKPGPSIPLKKRYPFPDLSSLTVFGKEVEKEVTTLSEMIMENGVLSIENKYPPRFLAIKLLEDDEEIVNLFLPNEKTRNLIDYSKKSIKKLEDYHGEDINTIISSEIYNNINKIVSQVVLQSTKKQKTKTSLADGLDHLTTHSFWGYVTLCLVILGIYLITFSIGNYVGGMLSTLYETLTGTIHGQYGENTMVIKILWDGGVGGFFGAVGGVLVYVVPFFLIIEILQDSGYLPRAAFLMDRIMHVIGVHGKTIIPMILGFGCNVPACAGCRIMETVREKKISVALTSLIPCAAVMTVVMGLVGRYLGLGWVLVLFLINFTVIIIVGRILNKIMPGECTELIMEMHDFRLPNYEVILKQTWMRTKEFVYKSMPLIIIIGIALEIMLQFNILDPVNVILSPITVFWLGLPAITGVFLLYGILRKELTLVLLSVLANSLGLSLIQLLTPIQMINFSLVTMLYIPCAATIIVIAKQTSWKYAIQISFMEIAIALLIGGIINFGFILIFMYLI